jgi:hypothetical protein
MVQFTLSRRTAAFYFLASLSVFAFVISADIVGEAGFPLDDAWIHQTYARNLAEEQQWAFIPGVPSAGSTAPLYTLLLAVGYLARVPFLWWASLLGIAALGAGALLAAWLAERMAPDIPAIGWWAGLATVAEWHLIWAASSGMETMLFATLTLALVAIAWRELDQSAETNRATLVRGLWFGVIGALTMLTRPEGVGLLVLLGLLMWLVRPQGTWRGIVLWSLGAVAGWLAGSLPYALLNLSLGSSVLPNTASAKQAEYAVLLGRSYLQRILDLVLPLMAGGQVMLVPGIVAVVWRFGRQSTRDRRNLLLLAPLFWALALIGLYAMRLPAAYQHGRYVMPALPHLVVCGVVGTAYLMRGARRTLWTRVASRTLGLTAVVLFAIFWVVGAQQYARDVQIIQSEMVVTARWLAENVSPEELLAVHDIGALGYYAPRPILDLAGLVSPEVIPIIRDGEALWQLMESQDVQYLMALPDQIPGHDEHDARLCPVFTSDGEWSPRFGGRNMVVYVLAWNEVCS